MDILIIEDNPDILEVLKTCFPLSTTASLISEIPFNKRFDLIIADRMLPDGDVLDHAYKFKEKETPIIMVSSLWQEEDIINAIKNNIDRYLTKPFSIDILEAYVEFFRRQHKQTLKFKDIKIDKNKKVAYFNNTSLNLTNSEIMILELLIENKSEIISREALLRKIGKDKKSRALDIHIVKLRQKIPYGSDIKTVHGKGYKLIA